MFVCVCVWRSYLSPLPRDPARRRAAAQAAAHAHGGLAVVHAHGRGEGLSQVTALAQDNAVLEARATLGSALRAGERERERWSVRESRLREMKRK